MPRRLQVQDPNAETPAVSPAASPVSTFYSPKLPGPALQAALDLAPLSSTLASMAQEQASREGERAYQAGKTLAEQDADRVAQALQANSALDTAEARAKANQKAFADLARDGKIEVWENPWALAGAMEALGRRRAREFGESLLARTGEVSTLIDPKTGQVVAPANPEAIVAEERKRLAKDSLSGDFYFQRGFSAVAAQAEESFLASASKRQAQAKIEASEKQATDELGSLLKSMASAKADPTDEEYAQIQSFVTQQFHDRGMDARAIVMSAVKYAYATAPIELRDRLLSNLEVLQVGTTTLGEDASDGGGRELLDDLRRKLDEDQRRLASAEDERLVRAKQRAETEAWGEVSQLYQDRVIKGGENAWEVFDQWRNTTGAPGHAVAAATKQFAALLEAGDSGNKDAEDGLLAMLYSGADTPAIRVAFEAAVARKDLSRSVLTMVGNELVKRETTAQTVGGTAGLEADVFRVVGSAHQDVTDALVGDATTKLDEAAKARFEYAKSGATPAQLAEWDAAKSSELKAWAIAERNARTEKRAQATSAISELWDKGMDAEATIKAAVRDGVLSSDAGLKMIADNASVVSAEGTMRSAAFTDMEQQLNILATSQAAEGDQAGKALWFLRAKKALSKAAASWHATQRSQFSRKDSDGALRAHLQETLDALMKDAGASLEERMKSSAGSAAEKSGALPSEVASAESKAGDFVVESDAVLAASKAGDYEAVYTTLFPSAGVDGVSDRFFETAAETWGKSGTFFNASPEQLRGAAVNEVRHLQTKTDLDDETRRKAAVFVLSRSYLPPDSVLAGTHDVNTDSRAANLAARDSLIKRAEALETLGMSGEFYRGHAARWEQAAAPLPVEIKPGDINPFTTVFFRNEGELKAFASSPDKAARLLEKLAVPEDQTQQWMIRQRTLLKILAE